VERGLKNISRYEPATMIDSYLTLHQLNGETHGQDARATPLTPISRSIN